jgi:lipoate-protein ligase B
MKRALAIHLGRRDYADSWELQKRLVARRQAGEIADVLVTVEHPDVITLGRKLGAQANVLEHDIPIFEIERGGDVTYHGPGQLVGYPILALEGDERDLHAYLRNLEEGLMRTCAEFGLAAGRREGLTGVWIDGVRKIASLGIAVRRWVTLHGFALNVATDLAKFTAINPCGLDAAVMTSIARETGRPVSLEDVLPRAERHLGETLGRAFHPATLADVGE